jgi:pimeloyl-ACP methyl ester carboxylesterase
MSIATIDNQQVHYEAIGHGEPLIFLHGWIGSWRYWWPTMQTMSNRSRAFALDFWGFGDSNKVPDRYLFGSYVEQLTHFIEHLGIARPVTLVGHSLGAAVAIRYANLWPRRIKRLALVSPPLDGNGINHDLASMEPVDFVKRYLYKFLEAPELKHELQKSDSVAVNSVANQLIGYDFSTDVEKIDRPVLVIYGDRDQVIVQPIDGISSAMHNDRNHHQVTLELCDHFPMLEQPSKFNRLLLDFFRLEDTGEIAPRDQWKRRTR